jgi:ribosomal-protein-serine acetyltransferase
MTNTPPENGTVPATPRLEAAAVAAPPEVIPLEGLVLRRWDPAWAEALQEAFEASLPELRPFMAWATDDHGLEQSREYIARSVAEWDEGKTWNYAILTEGGTVIGSVGLMTRMGPGVLELGYWIHTGYSGRGFSTQTARALAEVALGLPGVDRVAIKHDLANPASGRVAEKAGFVHVGAVDVEPTAPGQTGVEWVWERRR